MYSLTIENIGKCYGIYTNPQQRLNRLVFGTPARQQHWALKNISFSLKRGQCLGVIGDNGAGKSTLLKLLAGSIQPTLGQIQRDGRVTAILELGAGFHPDFTGRENLNFAGSFIGYSIDELKKLESEIIAFSELQGAIDRPIKTYSSGMVVRLAFALVTAIQPEVLIIDEALAVGDQHFQKKCVERIEAFRKNGCTILFCSHSLYHVRQLCDQVLWLDQGQMRGLGPMNEVISAYETHVRLKDSAGALAQDQPQVDAPLKSYEPGSAQLVSAKVKGIKAGTRGVLNDKDVCITLTARSPGTDPPSMGFMLEQFQGVGIMSMATHAEGVVPKATSTQDGWTNWSVTLTLTDLPLHSGAYVLSFYLFDSQGLVIFDEWKDHIVFDWVSASLTPGLVRLPHEWS
jgi:lipopolysaccharide transport system ATP-binding protein